LGFLSFFFGFILSLIFLLFLLEHIAL
jgi:hypothetical protein